MPALIGSEPLTLHLRFRLLLGPRRGGRGAVNLFDSSYFNQLRPPQQATCAPPQLGKPTNPAGDAPASARPLASHTSASEVSIWPGSFCTTPPTCCPGMACARRYAGAGVGFVNRVVAGELQRVITGSAVATYRDGAKEPGGEQIATA